jgi:hypothetical protein
VQESWCVTSSSRSRAPTNGSSDAFTASSTMGGEICLPEPLSRWTAVSIRLSFAGAAVAMVAGDLILRVRWRGARTGVEQGLLSLAGCPVLSLAGIITPRQRATLLRWPAFVASHIANKKRRRRITELRNIKVTYTSIVIVSSRTRHILPTSSSILWNLF